jgi:CrcB protein
VYAYLLVALGSALGGMARYGCSIWAAARWGTAFPWGTLLVNVAGSLAIGILAAFTVAGGKWVLPLPARELLLVGVLGGYTTFSAFSLQTLSLAQQGQWLRAGSNVVLSVVLCLLAVAAGYLLAHAVNGPRG